MPAKKSITDTSAPGQPKKPQKRGRPTLPRDANGRAIHPPKVDPVFFCCCCGKVYTTQEDNFVSTSSPLFIGNSGFYPVCRSCLNKYYSNVVMPAVDDEESRAIEVMCGVCDWYFDDEILDVSAKILEGYRAKGRKTINTTLPMTYGGRRNMTQYAKRGTTYLDTIKKRRKEAKIVKMHEEMMDPIDPDARRDEVDEADVWFFGPGYTAVQYKYLREQYEDWCQRYDCQSKAQEEIFKTLAIAQLNVQNAQQEGNQKRTTEAIKTLQDLMDTAKIKPKQKDDDALVEQNTFGTLIQKWENEEPIPEPKEEWKDVDGIRKYVGTWVFGHLAKMFKLDNEWSQMYDEEVGKYTVERPQYEANDDGESEFDILFKKYRNASSSAELEQQTGGDG